MAVAIDIGDAKDIHPRNKRDVGERLADSIQDELTRTGLVDCRSHARSSGTPPSPPVYALKADRLKGGGFRPGTLN